MINAALVSFYQKHQKILSTPNFSMAIFLMFIDYFPSLTFRMIYRFAETSQSFTFMTTKYPKSAIWDLPQTLHIYTCKITISLA